MAKSQGRVPRLYTTDKLDAERDITLTREASHYLVTVLRLGEGAEVRLFNENDGEWQCAITKANRKAADLVCQTCLRQPDTPPDIDYLFAPLKSARLDYLAQKATEMGAHRIRPVMTSHTVAAKVNVDRLRANAIEAAEQCNMVFVPEVAELQTLPDVLSRWSQDRTLIFCDERAEAGNPTEALKTLTTSKLAVLIGPEGGFSPDERDQILTLPNVLPVSLGPRIMRADTAGVAIMALVQAVVGDWR